MRHIEFLKVTFKNYTCYTEEMIYEFHNSKIQLLIGPNGTGKTNLFNSIPVCLYGSSPDGRKGEDLVNNKVKKNCYIFLDFKIDDDFYTVKRYIKDSKEGSTVLLYKNDTLIKKGHKEVLPVIEDIFMPMRLFINLLYLTQKGEMFIALEDSKKKELFEKLLDFSIYQQFSEKADVKIKDLGSEIFKTKSQIDLHSEMIIKLSNQILELETAADKFEEERSNNIDNLAKRINDVENSKNKISLNLPKDNESEFISIISKINETKNIISNIENKKQSEKKEIESRKETKVLEFKTKFNDEKNKLLSSSKEEIQKLENENKEKIFTIKQELSSKQDEFKNKNSNREKLVNIIASLETEIAERKKHLQKENPTCIECGAEIGTSKPKIIEILKMKQAENDNNKSLLSNIEMGIVSISDRIATLKSELSEIELKYSTEKDKIKLEEKEAIENLNTRYLHGIGQLDNLLIKKFSEIDIQFKNDLDISELELTRLEDERTGLEKELSLRKSLESDINKLNNQLIELKTELREKQNSLFDDRIISTIQNQKDITEKKLKDLTAAVDNKTSELSIYEFWKVGFSMKGIPSILIEESVPFINKQINFYLDKIGGRFKVSFDVLSETKSGDIRDKISISIFDTITHGDSYKQLSGGQARLIDIIIILTLRDLMQQYCGSFINIVLFDEIFDGLDEENIGMVSNLLRLLVGNQSYNIVSHRHIDQIEYDELYKTF